MDAPSWLTAHPIAHRGLHDVSGGINENTASATEAAIAAGYTIECDIRLAADGIVVFHDRDLDRLTDAKGPVTAQSVATLRKTRLHGTGDRILTLDEFLAIVGGRVGIVVEFKAEPGTDDARLVTQAVKSLLSYKGPVAVMSFSPPVVRHLKALAPSLPRGLVSSAFKSGKPYPGLSAMKKLRLRNLFDAPRVSPHFIAYDIRSLPAMAPLLLKRFGGLPLLSWTVRTAGQREIAKTYADQIIFEGFRPES
ncbi:MAG: glycerophosphodiester phosphodiesterase family protein [Hyphomicrobiales bacterium]